MRQMRRAWGRHEADEAGMVQACGKHMADEAGNRGHMARAGTEVTVTGVILVVIRNRCCCWQSPLMASRAVAGVLRRSPWRRR